MLKLLLEMGCKLISLRQPVAEFDPHCFTLTSMAHVDPKLRLSDIHV